MTIANNMSKISTDTDTACMLLKKGEVVAVPTETVYGLAADATQDHALNKIFDLKRRPHTHPLIVHIHSIEQLSLWAKSIPSWASYLCEQLWPGPLTVVLKRQDHVSSIITGGQTTIALRVPNHPLFLNVLQSFKGICAPSANLYGQLSPTCPAHVANAFQAQLPLILDGGACPIGVESTIIDCSSDKPTLLRPGMVTADTIESIIKQPLANANHQSPRAPGRVLSHYAPRTPLTLIDKDQVASVVASQRQVGLITFDNVNLPNTLIMPREAHAYAAMLYKALHQLDNAQLEHIYIEQPPQKNEWLAINDRLQKAATPH